MYCKYCGRQIADDSKFCEFCGNLIQNAGNTENAEDTVSAEPLDIGEPIFKDVKVEEETQIFAPAQPPKEPVITEQDPEEPEEEPVPPEPKKMSKGLLWGLISGGVALIVAIILIVYFTCFHHSVTLVNVPDFIDFKVSGYDGYGVAVCEMDWDGLETAAFGEYPTGSDSKTRKKQTEYKEKVATLKSAIEVSFEKQENVSVGDKLKATVQVDTSVEKELYIEFSKNRTAEYTVTAKDLNGSSSFELLEEFIDVKIEGNNGNATASLNVKNREKDFEFTTYDGTKYIVSATTEGTTVIKLKFTDSEDETFETVNIGCEMDNTEKLSNNDKITVKLDKDSEDKLMDYGLALSGNEKEFTVSGLNTVVSKVKELDSATLNSWNTKYKAELQKYVLSHWAEFIHGGNTVATVSTSMTDVQLVNKVLARTDEENALYLVYAASISDDAIFLDNDGMPQTCYFAVVIRNLVLDSNEKLLADGVKLPTNSSESYLGAYTTFEDFQAERLSVYTEIDKE